MANTLRKQITMQSRLDDIPAMIEKLRLDPTLESCIEGRESAFTVAMQEVLANAIVHGNHSEVSRKVRVRYICDPGHALSILICDEGDGFEPSSISGPKTTEIDRGIGIHLMKASMDVVQFRKNGTETYMRMNQRARNHSEEEHSVERSKEATRAASHG
jgi:anti-sigma regulatory factor (Ser/Thr protein kinase)